MSGWIWRLSLVACFLLLSGCATDTIRSQVAEDLVLTEQDLPAGWTRYLDEPKLFDAWSVQDRLNAQRRGYIDGHQRTFVNSSEGMITVANSIYANANPRELYEQALEPYANTSRIHDGRNETLQRLPNPAVGSYSFEYNITIPNEQLNFSYFEFFFIEKNVMTHVRCLAQERNVVAPQKFCESLLPVLDERIRHQAKSSSKPVLKDTLLIVPVEEFTLEKTDLPLGWAQLQDQPIKRTEVPRQMSADAGPGEFIEGRLRAFKNDSNHQITVVTSLYANAINENTFASKNDSHIEEFTRVTSLDTTHSMQRTSGRNIGERTWWVNLTRPDGTRYVNVYFGSKNIMVEVICDMPSYNESREWCDRVAQLSADKVPKRAVNYSLPAETDGIMPVAVTFPPYDSATLIQDAQAFLKEQYTLPNGSVGEAMVTEYNATLLSIDDDKVHLKYLVIKLNRFKERYGNESMEQVMEEECKQEYIGTSYETCMQRAPGVLDQVYFPVFICPISISPDEITGSVGPGGRCIGVEGPVDTSNQELLKELGSGYRYRYLRNIQHKDPFGGGADIDVNNFIINLMAANWTRQVEPVVEVQFGVHIGGLGCNPYSIRVYFDHSLRPVTANEEVMCAD